jgi:hypothetical protein
LTWLLTDTKMARCDCTARNCGHKVCMMEATIRLLVIDRIEILLCDSCSSGYMLQLAILGIPFKRENLLGSD